MDAENCLVCLDILYEPHFALPCQHLFCKLCVRNWEFGNCLSLLPPEYQEMGIQQGQSQSNSRTSSEDLPRKIWWRKEAKIAQETRLWWNFISFANYAVVQFIYGYDDNYCHTCVVLDV